ncbi:MAG: hypothetical protein CYPHOPRED_002950 [Cyphobasidiales sp. Tagirdzhanova-0007]|nr:MAG: hypothetical protein CYPHOPRED_002950 [Cyphobasidiales sp. Tagirdzhanova-0007]
MAAASRSLFTAGTSRKAVAGITLFQRFNKPSFRSISALTDAQVIQRPSDTEKWKRIAATTAAVVIGAGALSFLNNRETRDPLSPFEASYLNKTFTYVGVGLGITASSAYALHKTGASFRIMRANPWLVIGGSLAAGIGTMIMAMRTAPENTGAKHFWWTAFNVAQSATLSPLFFFNPALLARAGLYTAGVVGSLAYVGATARSDQYLYIGGPLFAGLCVVALSGLAPLVLPVGTAALAATQGISLYGGLAVFGGFVLYDTQKVLQRAKMAEAGTATADPVGESIRFELDVINIFVRIVQILGMQQRRK